MALYFGSILKIEIDIQATNLTSTLLFMYW